ncbi:hypothetical protein PSI19_03175 [Xenorhabdus khoisanae]|uniref:hypothetical protein n=1 Tax=Xenorhabdus khoisanae TaxID=880157 RepID=UPI002359560C|nr:hypothetical protein [Xenorhabdus khoisanae]MDC9612899.1 hypothetical protein [Xenorhabdus khoisanae]
MKDLQKSIQENSSNLKNQKNQKESNLLDTIRGGEAPANQWLRVPWSRSMN